MKLYFQIILCSAVILVTLFSVDAKGLHFITLELVLENCNNEDVHFTVEIRDNINQSIKIQHSLGCSGVNNNPQTIWTNMSYLDVYAGRSPDTLKYEDTVPLPVMIHSGDEELYTNNSFIFYGNESQVSFWNRDNTKTFDISDTLNEAVIILKNELCDNVSVTGLSDLCYKCQYYPVFEDERFVLPMETVAFKVDSRFLYTLCITKVSYSTHKESSLYLPYNYEEKARYFLPIKDFNKSLNVWLIESGCNTYLPLVIDGAVLIFLASVFTFISLLVKYSLNKKLCMLPGLERLITNELGGGTNQGGDRNTSSRDINSSSHGKDVSEDTPLLKNQFRSTTGKSPYDGKKERLKSLDTFRGFSLCIMIFVNYGGGGYWFFDHSTWNGLTVADLVFPWFIWIMGVSLVFSFRGRAADSKLSLYYQILRRSVILFGLGVLFANNCYDLSKCRVPGVLQRFAITYFVCASIEFIFLFLYKLKYLNKLGKMIPNQVSELYYTSFQWAIMAILEVVWLVVTFGVELEGCPRGYIGPGGISDDGNYSHCTGGVANYIDTNFFGVDHIYSSPTCKEVYKTGAYDPEGTLGSLNSIVMCYFGVYAGKVLLYHKGHVGRIVRWLIWGLITGLAALLLCEGKQNDGWIPINKNLWSLSFILSLTSTAFILLTVLYLLIDVFKLWNGAPFRYVGLNSILIYMGHMVFQLYFPFSWKGMENDHATFLLSNEIGVAIWMLIAFYCDYIKFYIKI